MTVQFDKLDNDLKTASSPVGAVAVTARRGLYRNVFKRVLDVSLVLLIAPVVLPIVAVLAYCVSRDGYSPFYQNTRVGKGGRNFSMLKLRTMVPNADRLLNDFLMNNSEARKEWARTQKLKNDPRITHFGRILRKTSLDELPQLWNVFVGDMSLVGPRPMLPVQREIYPGQSYYLLSPGITGPWQVSDRNEGEFSKRAEHDRKYNENLSIFSDISYLFRTVGVVFRATGY